MSERGTIGERKGCNMFCSECERVRRYMSMDPELYRGEDHRCLAHRRIEVDSEYVKSKEELLKNNKGQREGK